MARTIALRRGGWLKIHSRSIRLRLSIKCMIYSMTPKLYNRKAIALNFLKDGKTELYDWKAKQG